MDSQQQTSGLETPDLTGDELAERYRRCRDLSLELCSNLTPEVFRVQSMPDVSPPWWNLGHTTWFFAKNILEPFGQKVCPGFEVEGSLEFALNSYYETHGERVLRHERGLLTRPTTEDIFSFRCQVDEMMLALIDSAEGEHGSTIEHLVATGIHHEQQHQELLVTELKHIYFTNPRDLRPSLLTHTPALIGDSEGVFVEQEGGLFEIGHRGDGWCWDNELPRHKVWLEPFQIYDRLVTVGEYLEFIEDGGYQNALLWLANGWTWVKQMELRQPLYWEDRDGERRIFTTAGERALLRNEPVCHLSFYEADAFANWKSHQGSEWQGARLPTEAEWEVAANRGGFEEALESETANLLRPGSDADFLSGSPLHPVTANVRGSESSGQIPLRQICGDLWEWTSSHYEPYPGYRPFDGDLMEYNGKFMDNQRVLRGGSCATPAGLGSADHHLRSSYRNFWHAETRFQFTGLRLARSDEER